MSDSEDEVLERPVATEIPVLDRIVKPSKQRDLADLLIKIIQTNEEEDRQSLTEYEADVSSATLRDIDAKLSAALQSTGKIPTHKDETGKQHGIIPMLTEVAEFPVNEKSVLGFPVTSNKEDDVSIDFPLLKPELEPKPLSPTANQLPTTSQVSSNSDAANSSDAPDPANQDHVPEAVFSLAAEPPRRNDGSISNDRQVSALELRLQESSAQIINELVEQHAVAIRHELEQRLVSLRDQLLQDLFDTDEV